MHAKKTNGKLVIDIPLQRPKRSASGKTMVVATTRGAWESGIEIDGKPVKIILNAFVEANAEATDQDERDDEPKTRRRK